MDRNSTPDSIYTIFLKINECYSTIQSLKHTVMELPWNNPHQAGRERSKQKFRVLSTETQAPKYMSTEFLQTLLGFYVKMSTEGNIQNR